MTPTAVPTDRVARRRHLRPRRIHPKRIQNTRNTNTRNTNTPNSNTLNSNTPTQIHPTQIHSFKHTTLYTNTLCEPSLSTKLPKIYIQSFIFHISDEFVLCLFLFLFYFFYLTVSSLAHLNELQYYLVE